MLDKVDEFFSHLKERFRSPLFFSFIISWLLCNWRITVPLIWYNESQLEAKNSSYVQLISDTIDWCHGFLLPFGLALLYTIAYPFIKERIKWLMTKAEVWGTKLELKARKQSPMSFETFLHFKEQNDKTTNDLIKTLNKEIGYIRSYQKENQELKEMVNRYAYEKQDLLKKTDNTLINGIWVKTLTEKVNQEIVKRRATIEINNGGWTVLDERNNKKVFGVIDGFHYRELNREILFIVYMDDNTNNPQKVGKLPLINRLRISADGNIMTGTEQDLDVKYEKQAQ